MVLGAGVKVAAGILALVAGLILIGGVAGAAGQCGNPSIRTWCKQKLSPERRTALLMAAMTPEQRISLLGGDDIGAISSPDYTGKADGIASLGIPELLMADGPFGIRVGSGTLMPSSQAPGATFSRSLASRYGQNFWGTKRATRESTWSLPRTSMFCARLWPAEPSRPSAKIPSWSVSSGSNT